VDEIFANELAAMTEPDPEAEGLKEQRMKAEKLMRQIKAAIKGGVIQENAEKWPERWRSTIKALRTFAKHMMSLWPQFKVVISLLPGPSHRHFPMKPIRSSLL